MKKYLIYLIVFWFIAGGIYGLFGFGNSFSLSLLMLSISYGGFSTLLDMPQLQLVFPMLAAILYIIAGIGLLLKKNWSIVLCWVAFLPYLVLNYLSYIQSVSNAGYYSLPYLNLALQLVVVIFLSTRWNKLNQIN